MASKPVLVFSFCLIAAAAANRSLAQHADDFWPAASAAGQLKLSPLGFHAADDFVDLSPAEPPFSGWSSDEPGFDDIDVDDPGTDSFALQPGSVLRLSVVALQPGLQVWTPALQNVPVAGSALLGSTSGEVHTHVFWNIRDDLPEFNPLQTLWRGTFQLIDSNGQYSPSEMFTVRFRNVTCVPGDVDGDQLVNNFDIDPFVAVLLNPAAASAEARCAADIDADGFVTNFDIDPFVELLLN